VIAQAFYLFNSRFLVGASYRVRHLFTNPVAWYATGVLGLLQLGFVYLPFMQQAFGTASLEARHWLVPLAVGAGIFVVVELEKFVQRRWLGARDA